MAAGGFKFGQASAIYDSASYTTKRDWALAVHKARCDAFFKAQFNAGDEWVCANVGSITDTREPIPGETYTLYIDDLHPTSSDTTGQYPAFVTFFTYNDVPGAEYAIITSNGMHRYSSYESDITYGMYIHNSRLPHSSNYYKYSFSSLAHSYADNGFSGHSFSTSLANLYELPVLPICGFYGRTIGSSNTTANDSSSVIYNPAQNVTYSFGYAIRGLTIECFYKTSQYTANSGWNWSIIGRILTNEINNGIAYYSYYNAGYEKDPIDSSYSPRYSNSQCPFACINNQGEFFPSSSSGLSDNVTRHSKLSPSYIPNRCNTSTPSDLLYSAGCLSYCQDSGNLYTETSSGIDGNGNCVAGLINTDILRIVARQACTVGGATYQGGNFVCPLNQIGVYNADDFGILLGWDPSNESIV